MSIFFTYAALQLKSDLKDMKYWVKTLQMKLVIVPLNSCIDNIWPTASFMSNNFFFCYYIFTEVASVLSIPLLCKRIGVSTQFKKTIR